jgi:type II secretory pathway pseudopilin PulG
MNSIILELDGTRRYPCHRAAIEIDCASGNQGNSLRPLGARTFSKGICSLKSGVLPDANFAFSPYMRTFKNMKRSLHRTAGFSLVEVTLALGVAALCLLVLLGLLPTGLNTQKASIQQTTANQIISTIFSDLRADIRLPPGLDSKVCGDDPGPCAWGDLHGHWRDVAVPFTLYFTNEAKQTGTLNGDPPADAVFRATIVYRFPPSETTTLADITVTWPAQVDPTTGTPAGSVTSLIAVNR